jgi:hypothetical protein
MAILSDALPGVDRACTAQLIDDFRRDGWVVIELNGAQVCSEQELVPSRFLLYVIPQCRSYPAMGLAALQAYSRGGGHVLFLGGPFLDDPVWQVGQIWLNRTAIDTSKRGAVAQRKLADGVLEKTDIWQRTCNAPATAGSWQIVMEGPTGQPCYRFHTENLTGWDGYLSPDAPQLFGTDHGLLSFRAKGTQSTRQLVIELQEQDGSRWMAVVEIGPEWQPIGLDAFDFRYWVDSPTRGARGQAGDHVEFSRVRRIGFQLAFSHTPHLARGKHTFWIAEVGTAPHPVDGVVAGPPDMSQTLEGIFPRYKVYPVAGPVTLRNATETNAGSTSDWPEVESVLCAVPRPGGLGSHQDQKWRYIPWLEAVTQNSHSRGNAAWLLLQRDSARTSSILACLGISEPAVLASARGRSTIVQMAACIRRGLFLREAGASQFAYWPNETAELTAEVVNVGADPETVEVRTTVRDEQEQELLAKSQTLAVPAGSAARSEPAQLAVGDQPRKLLVRTELYIGEVPIDSIAHEVHVLNARVPDRGEFLTVQGNQFLRGEQPWNPVGINYWPHYIAGMDAQDFGAGWLRTGYYDPALVEGDLVRMEKLGVNLVSIQAPELPHHRNLLDFIERCRRHDVLVNLYCGWASPLAFRERELREYLTTARLPDNPTLIAYDTIWEPGNYVFQGDRRAGWDEAWRDWVVEQYGSITAAETDWSFTGRRDPQGNLISPPDEHFQLDGPWRVMMAAYRRFMDDLTSHLWNRAHRKLREIDPHHLVSFRQGNTLPHDFVFTGTPKHVDFICPEGYAIPPGNDGYYAAAFITKYLHFTTRGKPIVWSEFGQSVWDAQSMSPDAKRIKEVAEYHELFYRMALASGANGTIPWWWPGGYRNGENSDFGIIDPDGTPRPAAELMLRYGPQLKTVRPWPQATAWFDMDRDAHAGGYWYVCFNSGRDAYRQAEQAGQHLGVRSAGTDTTSATAPHVAIGNHPATGQNPLKYLNAEFNWLQVQDANGKWVEAEDGATIQVASGQPVRARISVGNTQEATWLAGPVADPPAGTVTLGTTEGSELQGRWPIAADTPYLGDTDLGELTLAPAINGTTKVELRMSAAGRGGFGDKRNFTLKPQNVR